MKIRQKQPKRPCSAGAVTETRAYTRFDHYNHPFSAPPLSPPVITRVFEASGSGAWSCRRTMREYARAGARRSSTRSYTRTRKRARARARTRLRDNHNARLTLWTPPAGQRGRDQLRRERTPQQPKKPDVEMTKDTENKKTFATMTTDAGTLCVDSYRTHARPPPS